MIANDIDIKYMPTFSFHKIHFTTSIAFGHDFVLSSCDRWQGDWDTLSRLPSELTHSAIWRSHRNWGNDRHQDGHPIIPDMPSDGRLGGTTATTHTALRENNGRWGSSLRLRKVDFYKIWFLCWGLVTAYGVKEPSQHWFR